jgi:ribosomal-protein-alanine N-acetyltransferase
MKYERPIIFTGKLVSIGLMIEDDSYFIYQMVNDPEVTRFLRFPYRIHSLEEEIAWVRNTGGDKDTTRVFSIVVNGSGDVAGIVSLHEIDFNSKTGYLAYSLAKRFWGMGYTTEAASLAMKYAFVTLNLRKLHSSVYEPNKASSRVLEKNGFHEVGRYHGDHYVPGHGYVDEIFYETFNPDFL